MGTEGDEDDAPRRPTVEDYRAFLGAARAWEATTRPELLPPSRSEPHSAYELCYVLAARLGILASGHPAYLRPHQILPRNAAIRVFTAVILPVLRSKDGTPPSSLGYTPSSIPELTAKERLRLASACDALAGAIEAFEAVEAMTEEQREEIDREVRKRNRSPKTARKDARALELHEQGMNNQRIAATLEAEGFGQFAPGSIGKFIQRARRDRDKL